MLRIENLGKRYGDHIVFEGLTRRFQAGCFALCEEDNTGKSTLLGLIAGVLPPDSGNIWIGDCSLLTHPEAARTRLAFVPDNCLLEPARTGREHLEATAKARGTIVDTPTLDLAERLGLTPHLDKTFEQMSTGTRRKVYLTAAGIGEPAVILADGPTGGLDAPARATLADQFRAWGKTRVVLFASHDADLVEACAAERITIK